MRTLILGKNQIVNSENSRFRYNFQPNILIKNMSVAVASLIIPYAWRSVSTRFNNNTFQIIYNGITYTLTLPSGTYSLSDINKYIQYWCIQNSLLYCISSTGQFVYYIELIDNATTYSYEIRCYPTTAPAGATTYGVFNGFCPQFVVPSTNNFGKIIGVNAGTYPSISTQATNYVKSSDFAPSPSPINQIFVNTSLDNNKDLQSSSNNVIWSFTPSNTNFGENIQINPSEFGFIKCSDNNIAYIDVWLTDQDNMTLELLDPNSVIMLLLKEN